MDHIHVHFLIAIMPRCYHWGKLGEGYAGSLSAISHNRIDSYNYQNKKLGFLVFLFFVFFKLEATKQGVQLGHTVFKTLGTKH